MLVTQSCPTFCNTKDCNPPGSSVRGTLQIRILEWVAYSFSREFSQPKNQTGVSCIAGRFSTATSWATRELCLNSSSSVTSTIHTCLSKLFPPVHCVFFKASGWFSLGHITICSHISGEFCLFYLFILFLLYSQVYKLHKAGTECFVFTAVSPTPSSIVGTK